MKGLNINHLAVVAAIVSTFVLGFLWYGPLFGDSWMSMVGLTQADVEAGGSAGTWITNVISSAAGMYGLAWLFAKLNVSSIAQGVMIAAIIGIAFVLLPRMTNDLFASNPYGLSWITGGFEVVKLVIGGIILSAWRK
ncbi:MAG: DUF1761 domain-containing protein [Bacteroidota bacterium]